MNQAATELGEVPRRLRLTIGLAGESIAHRDAVPIVSADAALAANAEATYGLCDDSVNQIPGEPASSTDVAAARTLDSGRSVQ